MANYNFDENKIKELGLKDSYDNSSRSTSKPRLEFNKIYDSSVVNSVLESNENGYPFITVSYKLKDDDKEILYDVRYPFTLNSKQKKMREVKKLLKCLQIDTVSISKEAKSDLDLLEKIVENINNKRGTKVLFTKKGKPTSYKYVIEAFGEEKDEQ